MENIITKDNHRLMIAFAIDRSIMIPRENEKNLYNRLHITYVDNSHETFTPSQKHRRRMCFCTGLDTVSGVHGLHENNCE